jgi:hypothetical protein
MSRSRPLPNWIAYWLPVFFWCGVIFWLSHIPHLRIVQGFWDFWLRKAAHILEYMILARLLARAFTGTTHWPWRKIFAVSLACSFLYACTDEYHQTFVAGRVGSVRDVTFDSTGAWIALGLWP